MSNIKQLSQHLKILELFGLQHFSLFNFNLKSKNLKIISKKFKFYFIFQFLIVILICGMEYRHFKGMKETYGSENDIGYAFRFIAASAASVRAVAVCLESFIKVKSNKKFFVKFFNFKDLI